MEHLSKQQIVLLTLLVSFVTALATGVVTVSLMNQAPASVGQTISRVIERTIEAASPQSAAVESAFVPGEMADAVDRVASSTVFIKSKDSETIVGMGMIVSGRGAIVADKSAVKEVQEYLAVLRDGTQFPVAIVQSQINGDIVFLAPFPPNDSLMKSMAPITFASLPKLGQTVLSLSGTSSPILGQGIVTEISAATPSNSGTIIHTSISQSKVMSGSPLFTMNGETVGINLSSLTSNVDGANFYSIGNLKSVIPILKK
jgi:S1-C subfamily serine protease